MEPNDAVEALSALAHPGRLSIFRHLVRAGEQGLPAGRIAEATGSLPNTLSANLNILSAARLTSSRREGRSIIYTANFETMRDLLGFLMEDCCAGEPAICMPVSEMARAACKAC
jgi:ArsR family transcriptional regulator, arsenate/arsenite/antimonite-responsive transcriptional repressor